MPEELRLSWAYKSPDPWAWLPENERAKRAVISTDQCVIDGQQFFIRGCIFVPVHSLEEPAILGVWAGVTKPNYKEIVGLWSASGRENEPSFAARVANKLPLSLWPSTLSLKCRLQLLAVGQRPSLLIGPFEHPLGVDQPDGIDLQRARELATVMEAEGLDMGQGRS